jgi:hypothetical protein
MRPPRVRVRTLLITVAALALLLAGGLEVQRLSRLSQQYRNHALGYGANVRMRLLDLARAKQEMAILEGSPRPDAREIERVGLRMDRLRADIAANSNLVQIYEHAASHPWERPPLIAEANESVEDAPIPKRFVTRQAALPPPGSPDSSPRTVARETAPASRPAGSTD